MQISDGPLRQLLVGVGALLLRRGIGLALGFAGMVVLARFLAPGELGVAVVASFVLAVGLTLGDIGSVPFLLQQRAEPTTLQLRALFGYELGRTLVVILAIWLLGPQLARLYTLDPLQMRFVQALALTALLGAICTIPAVLLERRLAYPAIARIDIAQNIAQQLSLIAAVLAGAGVWSFLVGALAGGVARLILTFYAAARLGLATPAHWLRPAWRPEVLAQTIRLGGPVQLGGITHLLRENLPALLAGPFYSLTDLGYLRWAQRTSAAAVQPVTQSLSRVGLAALARTQDDTSTARTIAELLLRGQLALILPALALLTALMPALLRFVFTPAWAPAQRAAAGYALALVGGELTLLLVNVGIALGLAGMTLGILMRWTLLQAGLALVLTPALGFEGVALAAALSTALPLWETLRLVRKRLGLLIWPQARLPLLAALLAGSGARAMLPLANTLFGLTLVASAGLALATATLLLGEPKLRRLVFRPVL